MSIPPVASERMPIYTPSVVGVVVFPLVHVHEQVVHVICPLEVVISRVAVIFVILFIAFLRIE